MQQVIRIPEPCFENWNEMSPREQGRHCHACAKTVVDFTDWELQDILAYLQANTESCGRFRNDQLNVPIPAPDEFVVAVYKAPLSLLQKIAAVFVFVFCILAASCNEQPAAEEKTHLAQTMELPSQTDTTGKLRNIQVSIPDSIAIPPVVPAHTKGFFVMETHPDTAVKVVLPVKIKKKPKAIEATITGGEVTGGIPVFEQVPDSFKTKTIYPQDTAKH